jgi:hypothetical protein
MTPGRLSLCLVAALAAAPTEVRATPLDSDTCAKFHTEQVQLKDAGVDRELAKSPMWALANLAPEKLAQIRRYIELEEQLLFRCRSKALVNLAPEKGPPAASDTAQDKDENDADGPEANEPGTAPAGEPRPKAKTEKPARKAAAPAQPKKQEPARKPAAAKAPAKAAARAKADDAYKAPPADPSVDPFADQLKLPANQ